MKKSKKCPKCESTKILTQEHGCIQPREFVEVGILSPIGVMRYICTECGFVEEWIEPPVRLNELVDKRRAHRHH
jgi:ribosomal protein S27AE